MWHVVEKIGLDRASQYFFCSVDEVMGNGGAIGVSEVGAGIACLHVELAIFTIAIKRDQWFFFTKV